MVKHAKRILNKKDRWDSRKLRLPTNHSIFVVPLTYSEPSALFYKVDSRDFKSYTQLIFSQLSFVSLVLC